MTDLFAEMTEAKEIALYASPDEPASSEQERIEQSITEDHLVMDHKFVNNAKVMYRLMQGEPFTGTDEEAGRYGINLIGEFNYNFALPFGGEVGGVDIPPGAMSQVARLYANGSRENAMRWLYMMDQYERLPNWTASGSWRMARGMFRDPSTWGALFTAGTGFAARKAGQEGLAKIIRGFASTLATKKAAAVGGATYTGVPAAGELKIKEQADIPIEPEDIADVALQTSIGAAAGPALMTAAEMAPQAVRAIGDILGDGVDAGAVDAASNVGVQ
ncbi:MAG: hypothetical protein ACO3U3_10075 [Alphaproteobacteria bacterium]